VKIERFEDIDPPAVWRIEAWQPVESLKVVRLARELTRKVYRLTKKPGFAKDYGLKRQTRLPDGGQVQDAAGSSMHNIAEGFDSETNAEFIRFLRYAKRSCTEVQSELYVALDEGYISPNEFKPARHLAGGDVYEQARQTFTLLGDSDRACCRSWIHQLSTEI